MVYEWEDIMKESLGCNLSSLHATGVVGRKIRSLSVKLTSIGQTIKFDPNCDIQFVWVMNSKGYRNYSYKNCIPIYLDFPSGMVEQIKNATKDLPCYWVTSYAIYEQLVQAGSKNVYYIPISISDKYRTIGEASLTRKSLDVIQFGRKNPVLHDYMLSYCKRNPEVEYVYQTYNGSLTYCSTTRGDLGKFDDRNEYMSLLSSAKVSLVSTPAFDCVRDFGGVDFVTPRFFESAAMYCHMIGRYTENKEAELLEIGKICPNVASQEEFDALLTQMLSTENAENVKKYEGFLKKNVTSERMKAMKRVLDSTAG